VDALLRSIDIDDDLIHTLVGMATEGPDQGRDHGRLAGAAREVEMAYLKQFRTRESPPMPLFSGEVRGARECEVLTAVLSSVQLALADTIYVYTEQSTLPVDPNPDPSRPLAADPDRPLHCLPDAAPELLFEMHSSTVCQMLEVLVERLKVGVGFDDSLCAGLLLGLVAVIGRPYMVTERAFEVHRDDVAEHPLGLVDSHSDGADDPPLGVTSEARAVAMMLTRAALKDDDVEIAIAARFRLVRFLIGMLTHNEKLLDDALLHPLKHLQKIAQEGRRTSGGAFECMRCELLNAPQFSARSDMLLLFHDELHATVLQPLVTTEKWWRHLKLLRDYGHDYERIMRDPQLQRSRDMRYSSDAFGGLPEYCPSDFSDLMELSADFYAMLAQRDAMKDWSEFAAESGLKLVAGLSVPYLRMLTGLAGPDITDESASLSDPESVDAIIGNAVEVWTFLRETDAPETSMVKGHGKSPSWLETLYTYVQKLADDLEQQAREQQASFGGQPMPPGPLDTQGTDAVVRLTAFLRLLRRVYNNANAQGVLIPAPDEAIVPIWRLFVAKVHRSVKAEALLVLEAFCRVSDLYSSFMCVRMASLFHRDSRVVPAAMQQYFTQFQIDVATLEISDQEYPLTRALLSMLHTLLPRLPMVGDTYTEHDTENRYTYIPELNFVDRYIFRCAFSPVRYRDENEKWAICNKVLTLYVSLLESYEPQEQHFQGTFVSGAERAGYDLLGAFLHGAPDTDNDRLRQVFKVIEEGAIHPTTHKGAFHADFQSAVHYALEVLVLLLRKQSVFVKLSGQWNVQNAARGNRVTHGQLRQNSVEQHILKPCGAAGACTRALAIGRLVYEGVGFEVDDIALNAIKVLWHLSLTREQHALVDVFNRDRSRLGGVVEYPEMKRLVQSFAMRLYGEVGSLQLIAPRAANDVFEFQHPHASIAIQHSIVHFILQNLRKRHDRHMVTLSHYLLGFGRGLTTTTDITKTRLVGLDLGYRTCLKEMLTLVRPSSPGADRVDPVLAELIFKLIYKMCFIPHTSRPTLEYLRSPEVDFFRSQLDRRVGVQPVAPERGKGGELQRRRREEGEDTALQPSREYAAELARQGWLLRTIAIEVYTSLRAPNVMGRQPHDASGVIERMLHDVGSSENEVLLLKLLKPVSFHRSPVQLDVTEESEDLRQQINRIFRECVHNRADMDGVLWCDCRRLIDMLHDLQTQSAFTGAAVDQPKFQERLMQYYRSAIQMNEMWAVSHSKLIFFDGWRRAIGVSLKLRPPSDADRFIPHILCELLGKIREKDELERVPELLAPVAEVVVLLINKLREHYAGLGAGGGSGPVGPAGGVLTQIHRGITSAIRTSGVDRQARQNFYCALLSYYTITCRDRRGDGVDETFLALVCRDAADSAGLLSALALSTITTMVRLDQDSGTTYCLAFLQRRGILRQLAHQIKESDSALLGQLDPAPKTLEHLSLHCARMALLNQVAQDPAGAAAVADSEALWELRHCQFVSPPGGRPPEDEDALRAMQASAGQLRQHLTTAVTPRAERHRELVVPILHLAVSTLQKAVGSRRRVVLDQILHFIDAHAEEYFKVVLHDTVRLASTSSGETIRASPLSIEELGVVTALIRQISGPRDAAAVDEILGRHTDRFERLMLAILPVLANPDETLAKFNFDAIAQETKREVKRGLMNALANVVGYIHTRMGGGVQAPGTGQPLELPQPKLAPVLQSGSGPAGRGGLLGFGNPAVAGAASLDTAIQVLRAAQHHYLRVGAAHSGPESPLKRLRDGLDGGVHSKELALYIIETTLWVLWRHLDFYVNSWPLVNDRERVESERFRREFCTHVDFREEPDSLLSVLVTEVETRARLDAETEAKQSRSRGEMDVELNVVDQAAVYRPIIEPIVQQIFYLRRALER
jgi:hypothetical protein